MSPGPWYLNVEDDAADGQTVRRDSSSPTGWSTSTPGSPASNPQSGSYSLSLSDAGKSIDVSSSSPATITVPPHSIAAFASDDVVRICRMGAGTLTIAPGGGVTVSSAGGLLSIAARWTSVTLRNIGIDEWMLEGVLA